MCPLKSVFWVLVKFSHAGFGLFMKLKISYQYVGITQIKMYRTDATIVDAVEVTLSTKMV